MTDLDGPLQDTEGDLLIVDDDPPARRLLKRALERQGFRVREAGDGQDAVRQFTDLRPALVLLDVFMPLMDGFETCAAMRVVDPDAATPIIMLTAADDVETIDRAFDCGATDFILKPFNWTLLSQRLRYALRASAWNLALRQRHLRQRSARRLAKLLLWEWDLGNDRLRWDDDIGLLTDPGTKLPSLDSLADLLEAVHPQDRARVTRLLQRMRDSDAGPDPDARGDQAAHFDTDLRLELGERSLLVRMAGERGTRPADRNYVFGALHDLTDVRRAEESRSP